MFSSSYESEEIRWAAKLKTNSIKIFEIKNNVGIKNKNVKKALMRKYKDLNYD